MLESVNRIVAKRELTQQRFIWDQLFGWLASNDSIPRVLSSLLLQGCGISVSSSSLDVLQSLSKWDLWELFLSKDIAPSLGTEAQSIIRCVQRVLAETTRKIERFSLSVQEGHILLSNIRNIQKHFEFSVIKTLNSLRSIFEEYKGRRAQLKMLYDMTAQHSPDCLASIKQSLEVNEILCSL